MKKFSKLFIAGSLVLSMSVPVFGAITVPVPVTGEVTTLAAGDTGTEVTSEGTLTLPTIKVTLPTTHGFILNPFKLESKGQIVSAAADIKNESDVDVIVSLKSVSADIGGEAKTKAVLAPITAKTTAKTVELNLAVAATVGTVSTGLTEGKLNITDKVKAVELVTLTKTTGAATFTYEGAILPNPVNNPWTAADTMTIKPVYSFSPVVAE